MQNSITNFTSIGPFSKAELEVIAQKAYEGTNPTKHWVGLTPVQRDEQLGKVVDVLTGKTEGIGQMADAPDPFTRNVLQTLKQYPQFDQDEFVQGYQVRTGSIQNQTEQSLR